MQVKLEAGQAGHTQLLVRRVLVPDVHVHLLVGQLAVDVRLQADRD